MATKIVRFSGGIGVIVAAICALLASGLTAGDQPANQAEAERQVRLRQAELQAAKLQLQQMTAILRNQQQRQRLLQADAGGAEYDDQVIDPENLNPRHEERLTLRRPEVVASYFEQFVYGGRGENAESLKREELEQALRVKIGSLHMTCGLSDRQSRQLQLAGQGDMKRLFDLINRRKLHYLSARDEDAEEAMRDAQVDVRTFQRLLSEVFGKQSLLDKTLERALSTEQRSDYELACRLEHLGGKLMLRVHGSEKIKTARMNTAALADLRVDSSQSWKNLRGLSLESTPVVDGDLARLKKLAQLELLDLGGTRVTSDGLAHLQDNLNLKFLDLRRTAVDDAGMKSLSGLTNLQTLHLGCNRITGAGLVHLRNLKNLESLFVYQTQVAGDDLVHLEGLSKLKELGLDGTPVSDAGLAHLARLINLQTLALSSTKVGDAGLEHLKGLANLKTLTVFGTKVSEGGVAALKRALPGLKIIQ